VKGASSGSVPYETGLRWPAWREEVSSTDGTGSRGMIVCICAGISTREIESALRRGASTRGEIARVSGAGTSCGRCHPWLDSLLSACEGKRPAQMTLNFDAFSRRSDGKPG
jgi:bacterioferritin-associated ferredoxin